MAAFPDLETVWQDACHGARMLRRNPGFMAAATLTGVPVVAFFLILQRYLAGGLTAGAVKG